MSRKHNRHFENIKITDNGMSSSSSSSDSEHDEMVKYQE
jgi:hypothetical protein